jgi:tetratricopeptide (TPR) repeat protein
MLRHLPFFEALAAIEEGTPLWRATTAGLGVLRLVDAATTEGPGWTDANRWSIHAARTTAEAMDPAPARTVLLGLVELIADGGAGEADLLAGRLFAYARTLDLDARYDLAADVYASVAALAEPTLQTDVVIDAYMRLGYCHRMLGRFDDATVAYAVARQLAGAAGDTVKVLRGRVAEGNLARAAGNLPRAQAVLDAVIAEAAERGLAEVRAVALHDRATVAYARGDTPAAVRMLHAALEDAQSPIARDRLLGDIAVAFADLGLRDAARDAHLVLAATAQERHTRWAASINLLEGASLDGAELVFEQYRRQLEAEALPADLETTLALFVGRGYARFGRTEAARGALRRAATLASGYGFHQLAFEAEAAIEELGQPRRVPPPADFEVAEAVRPAVAAMRELRELVGAG